MHVSWWSMLSASSCKPWPSHKEYGSVRRDRNARREITLPLARDFRVRWSPFDVALVSPSGRLGLSYVAMKLICMYATSWNAAPWALKDNGTRMFGCLQWWIQRLVKQCIDCIADVLRGVSASWYGLYYWLASQSPHFGLRLQYHMTTGSTKSVGTLELMFELWLNLPSHASSTSWEWWMPCGISQERYGSM